jgi:hypothetical protein
VNCPSVFRPEEEANRKLRLTARNDLLQVDAFPSRPTGGARILRVFANVNLTEPRAWMTAAPFSELLARLRVFPPGSAWVVMTDTASHAVLRGRFALEHSYFVALDALALPEESPAALLVRQCGVQVLPRAA